MYDAFSDEIDQYGYPILEGEGSPYDGRGCTYCEGGWAHGPGLLYRCECNPPKKEYHPVYLIECLPYAQIRNRPRPLWRRILDWFGVN